MRQVRCILDCVMEDDGASTLTVGKVYDVTSDCGECFTVTDDNGDEHMFTVIGQGWQTDDEEFFEEVV